MIKEEFLHYLWQHQIFNRKELFTQSGEKIEILHPGQLNKDAGPDFFNARIRINDLLWVGNVEIHINSSDWFKHQHQGDPAYSKLILHIVWNHDKEVFQNSLLLPVLELKGRVSKRLIDQYHALKSSKKWVACEDQIALIDPIFRKQMLDRTAIERLQSKSKRIEQLLQLHKNDWETVFYQLLARSFGFKTNALPFELLSVNVPNSLVRKYRRHSIKLSALFFGQAGFLESEAKDDYHHRLKLEYSVLRRLHRISPIDVSLWKFLRMRPANFPTQRISQFVRLISKGELFSRLKDSHELNKIYELFELEPQLYWTEHYDFGKKYKLFRTKSLGKTSVDSILINAVFPLLFNWLRSHGKSNEERVLELLSQINAERNSITKKWKLIGLEIDSALDSQASLQLKREYCELKKCLNCTIGNAILKQKQ